MSKPRKEMSKIVPIALGQWPQAPLVFVLAQVRFLPSNMANLDVIKNALRGVLPTHFERVNALMGLSMEVGSAPNDLAATAASPIVVGYDFVNMNQEAVVRVMPDSLTYAVSHYKDYADFSAAWMNVVSVLPALGIMHIQRAGLRYVDFIYPAEGKVPEDYFLPPFDHRASGRIKGAVSDAEINMLMQEYEFERGRLRVQYARGRGQPGLPLDLQGLLPVAPSSLKTNHAGTSGTFDTDRWIDEEISSELKSLGESFSLLHNGISTAFKGSISAFAKSEWAGQKDETNAA